MVLLERFLIGGGRVNSSPSTEKEIFVVNWQEISPHSKNRCFLTLLNEGEHKVRFVKESTNPEKDFYVERLFHDLDLFPTNSLVYYGEDFCIYPLIPNYRKCNDRIKLARYLALVQKRYEAIDKRIRTRMKNHPGYRNRFRRKPFDFFSQHQSLLESQNIETRAVLSSIEASLEKEGETLCHGDYRPVNTFVIDNRQEIGIIDLEEVSIDTPTFDLARLLGSTPFDFWEKIIASYAREKERNVMDITRQTADDYLLYASATIISVLKRDESDQEKYLRPLRHLVPRALNLVA